ncbi:MAG: hypothetical protein QOI59_2924 [Gammaproteobacteria bacterium]|nr:hypothetical protein [Gammaproteobacteria bacterium]
MKRTALWPLKCGFPDALTPDFPLLTLGFLLDWRRKLSRLADQRMRLVTPLTRSATMASGAHLRRHARTASAGTSAPEIHSSPMVRAQTAEALVRISQSQRPLNRTSRIPLAKFRLLRARSRVAWIRLTLTSRKEMPFALTNDSGVPTVLVPIQSVARSPSTAAVVLPFETCQTTGAAALLFEKYQTETPRLAWPLREPPQQSPQLRRLSLAQAATTLGEESRYRRYVASQAAVAALRDSARRQTFPRRSKCPCRPTSLAQLAKASGMSLYRPTLLTRLAAAFGAR